MNKYWLVLAVALAAPAAARADAFDDYTNPILAKVPKAAGVERVKELTAGDLADHAGVLKGTTAAFVVVKTNDGRWCKLLVQAARQKVGDQKTLPIILVERYVTYKEGDERAVTAQGQNVRLFGDFAFSLDLGQVVPAGVATDLRVAVAGDKAVLVPVDKAEMYVVTKPLPEATPKKTGKFVAGGAFEPRYFTGRYQLYDDGRRSGILELKVEDEKEVTGWYFSDKDGQKYEVSGSVGTPNHALTFKVTFPQTIQWFQGFMFTGDGRAITGSSKLAERETGFYALRLEK